MTVCFHLYDRALDGPLLPAYAIDRDRIAAPVSAGLAMQKHAFIPIEQLEQHLKILSRRFCSEPVQNRDVHAKLFGSQIDI